MLLVLNPMVVLSVVITFTVHVVGAAAVVLTIKACKSPFSALEYVGVVLSPTVLSDTLIVSVYT